MLPAALAYRNERKKQQQPKADVKPQKVRVSVAAHFGRHPVADLRARSFAGLGDELRDVRHMVLTITPSCLHPTATTWHESAFVDSPQGRAAKTCLAFFMQVYCLLYNDLRNRHSEKVSLLYEVVYEQTAKGNHFVSIPISAPAAAGFPGAVPFEEDGPALHPSELKHLRESHEKHQEALKQEVGRTVVARRFHLYWSEHAYEQTKRLAARGRDSKEEEEDSIPPLERPDAPRSLESLLGVPAAGSSGMEGPPPVSSRLDRVMGEIALFLENKPLVTAEQIRAEAKRVDESDSDEEEEEAEEEEDDRRGRNGKRMSAAQKAKLRARVKALSDSLQQSARLKFACINGRINGVQSLLSAFVDYNCNIKNYRGEVLGQIPSSLNGLSVDDMNNRFSPRLVFHPTYSLSIISNGDERQCKFSSYARGNFLRFPVPECVYEMGMKEAIDYSVLRFHELPEPSDLGKEFTEHMQRLARAAPSIRLRRQWEQEMNLLDQNKREAEKKRKIDPNNPFNLDLDAEDDQMMLRDGEDVKEENKKRQEREAEFRRNEKILYLLESRVPDECAQEITFDSVEEANAVHLLRAKKLIEAKNLESIPEKEKREFERLQMLDYQKSAIGKFRAIWEGGEGVKISETSRLILDHLKKFLETDNQYRNFYKYLKIKPHADLSSTGDTLVWMSTYWQICYHCERNFTSALRMSLSFMHQYGKNQLNPHQLLVGEHSAGKSYLMDMVRKSAIPGVIVDLQSQSAMAQNVNGDTSDTGYVLQEFNPEILGGGKSGKDSSSSIEQNWKNKLTSNVIHAEVFRVNPKTGERETYKIHNKCNNTYALACNLEGSQLYKDPALSRFHKDEFNFGNRTAGLGEATTARALRDESSKGSSYITAASDYDGTWRMAMGLVWLVQKLLWTGVFHPIDMRYAENIISQILKEAGKNGAVNVIEDRNRARVMAYLRVLVILSAVFQHFIFNPNVETECRRPFDLSQVFELEPLLYPTAEQICVAVELGASQYESSLALDVMNHIRETYFPHVNTDPSRYEYKKRIFTRKLGAAGSSNDAKLGPNELAWAETIREFDAEYEKLKGPDGKPTEAGLSQLEAKTHIKMVLDAKSRVVEYYAVDPDRLCSEVEHLEMIWKSVEEKLAKEKHYTSDKIIAAYNKLLNNGVSREHESKVAARAFGDYSCFTVQALQGIRPPEMRGTDRGLLLVSKKSLLNGGRAPIYAAINKVLGHRGATGDLWIRPLTISPTSGYWEAFRVQPREGHRLVINSDSVNTEDDEFRLMCYANMRPGEEFDASRHHFDYRKVYRRHGREEIKGDVDQVSAYERLRVLGRLQSVEAAAPAPAASSSSSAAAAATEYKTLPLLPVSTQQITPAMERLHWHIRASKGLAQLRSYADTLQRERVRLVGFSGPSSSDVGMESNALGASSALDEDEAVDAVASGYIRASNYKNTGRKRGSAASASSSSSSSGSRKKKKLSNDRTSSRRVSAPASSFSGRPNGSATAALRRFDNSFRASSRPFVPADTEQASSNGHTEEDEEAIREYEKENAAPPAASASSSGSRSRQRVN